MPASPHYIAVQAPTLHAGAELLVVALAEGLRDNVGEATADATARYMGADALEEGVPF